MKKVLLSLGIVSAVVGIAGVAFASLPDTWELWIIIWMMIEEGIPEPWW